MGKEALAIERVADDVLAALNRLGAIGAPRACKQLHVARAAGTNPRTLQEATLVLNQRGVAVCTSCSDPPGVYLASNRDEVEAYGRQLHGRLAGNGKRLSAINRILRRMELEQDGRLFA